jgi:uncharacterized protein
MGAKPFDPRRLDVAAFAEKSGGLQGEIALSSLPRLAESLSPEPGDDGADAPVCWSARGERRLHRGAAQTWLLLQAGASVSLTCQRCLQPVRVPLAVDCRYRFVADEATAAQDDAEAEEDVLVLTRALDLPSLIEDELLLALPLVPRHPDRCPQPLSVPDDTPEAPQDTRRPFEALAGLKVRKAVN